MGRPRKSKWSRPVLIETIKAREGDLDVPTNGDLVMKYHLLDGTVIETRTPVPARLLRGDVSADDMVQMLRAQHEHLQKRGRLPIGYQSAAVQDAIFDRTSEKLRVLDGQEVRARKAREKKPVAAKPGWHADVKKQIEGNRADLRGKSNKVIADLIVKAWAKEDEREACDAREVGSDWDPPRRPSASTVRQAIPHLMKKPDSH